ncbi:hypothetical protein [Bordetella sp. BOR01]|uniref:hypothetical protein n=1 Tax=Bordetella sp. BOR01 TaxID=2854779 RepID=UPI001C491A35|nr:hypothetical protein [Bordetella sp. BOR01]MBV7483976.1 hypothetical protein [Bordetella sp. BOR01]
MQGIAAPFALTFRLWLRFWPQLMALVLAGVLAHDLLLLLAVHIGFANHLAGLAVLTLVALAQLVVTVTMFQVLLPGLPALRAAQAAARGDGDAGPAQEAGSRRLLSAVTIALLPFFAYYAAWGFLGNTVRQYSRLALDLDPFGTHGNILDALDSRWLLVSVAVSWLVRKVAKRLRESTGRPIWQVVVVLCETNWILIGLYVISRWKSHAWDWLVSHNLWENLRGLLDVIATPISAAWAAGMVPVESLVDTPGKLLVNLFFYALLPVVWLVMAALVYGYDVRSDEELLRIHHRVERFGERYRAIPKFLRDFITHFIGGYRSRYLPVANGVRLTLNAGVVLLVTLIVGYRLIEWGSAWLWIGASRLIGPHDLDTWQVLSHGLTLLFGSPFRDSSTGILIEPLRICFLAAVLETAFGQPARRQAPAEPAGQAA